jgi:hypothetical protein
MSEPLLLVLYDRVASVDLSGASHLQIAREEGFRVMAADWREIRRDGNGLSVGAGSWLLAADRAYRLEHRDHVDPAVLLHRVWPYPGVRRLSSQMLATRPQLLSSWDPLWGSMDDKWLTESCLRDTITHEVSRPRTYLVTGSQFGTALARTGTVGGLILKPPRGSQCTGILTTSPRTFSDVSALIAGRPRRRWVVQELVENGLVFRGRRCDLRVFVLVHCLDPQKLILPFGGVVRLAGRPYDSAQLSDPAVALTGNSYRKRQHLPVENIPVQVWLDELASTGLSVDTFWPELATLIQGVFACWARSPHGTGPGVHGRAYYIGGLDVLPVVHEGRLWPLFLEANSYPQLNGWGPETDKDLRDVHREWVRYLRRMAGEQHPGQRDCAAGARTPMVGGSGAVGYLNRDVTRAGGGLRSKAGPLGSRR